MNTHKTALITGGAQRIGAHLALRLAEAGYNIILHYHHSSKEAHELQKKISNFNRMCHLYSADLSNYDDTLSLIETLKSKFDCIDLIINNAATYHPDSLLDLEESHFNEQMQTNFKAPMLISKHFTSDDNSNHIINMLDKKITTIDQKRFSYWMSKKSLEQFTYYAACMLAPHTRVNAIAPGLMMQPVNQTYSEALLEEKRHKTPLQRLGNPDDIVNGILALESLTFTTGQVLFIDGGMHLIN